MVGGTTHTRRVCDKNEQNSSPRLCKAYQGRRHLIQRQQPTSVATQTDKPHQPKGKTALTSDRKRPRAQYVESWPALIDKYLQRLVSDIGISFAMVLAVVGLIFYQDNKAGQLKNWNDLLWTLQKCLVAIALYLILLLCRVANERLRESVQKKKGQDDPPHGN